MVCYINLLRRLPLETTSRDPPKQLEPEVNDFLGVRTDLMCLAGEVWAMSFQGLAEQQSLLRVLCNQFSELPDSNKVLGCLYNIGALIIRMWFWGPLYY